MSAAQRAITALNIGIPDEVPTFELEFQLVEEFFGRPLYDRRFSRDVYPSLSAAEKERAIIDLADFFAVMYGTPTEENPAALDYAIIPVYCPNWTDPASLECRTFRKRLREHFPADPSKPESRLFGGHGDGTFSIPDGNHMYDFAYRIADDPDEVKAEAERMCAAAIEGNKRQHEAGLDVALLCSDYCYNSGPFLSPAMFDEFVTPYLARICEAARADGMLVIKHTDGNIMPILDSLVACRPHALHSIDPMAGVDIREVKRLVGDKVALCGNVHCAALQTGTDDEVRASAEYCLTYGKEGGGYIFATSNVPFKGMPPERYKMILDIWKRMRAY